MDATMKIKNLTELATTPARRVALEIAEKGLETIDTRFILEKSLKITGNTLHAFGKSFKLSPKGKLIAVCIGKCAADAAVTFEKVLGDRLYSGEAIGVGPANVSLKKISYHAGTHPMPSVANVDGTKAILFALNGLTAEDTVLFLVSGGGSTLLAQPICIGDPQESIPGAIERERAMLADLFAAGATIQEVNTVRKHMSMARGGFMAENAYPAQVVSLIFSDVPGNSLEFIASGPTVKDDTTIADAMAVVKKYALDLVNDCLIETPKDDKHFERVYNMLTVSNELALSEMERAAKDLGFKAERKNSCIVGEAREIGRAIAAEANAAKPGTVLLYCGETTVTIKGHGVGGRNQEVALAALPLLAPGRVVLSLASDGHDNSAHAGALADKELAVAARAKGLESGEFLERNDSSSFFEAVGGLVETGDTGSNVSDLIIAVASK